MLPVGASRPAKVDEGRAVGVTLSAWASPLLVTLTTTGYGDISPRSGWAKFAVSVQILFGFLYNVLFFSIFAGLAGRRRSA